jgi:SAM-dependent methyltransferase
VPQDTWSDGAAYEQYVGRWSREVAPLFLDWARLPPSPRAIDVGCGTGALSSALLAHGASSVLGVDRAPAFVAAARSSVTDPRAAFATGDATSLDVRDGSFDAAVSGLVLNFIPEPGHALNEMARAVRPGGVVAVYVWDYSGKMEMMRNFWDAAVEADPLGAGLIADGMRFAICNPQRLADLFRRSGLSKVATGHVDASTVFEDFEDYWRPFTLGQGPGPSYVATLDGHSRERLRAKLAARVAQGADGRIAMVARALTSRGEKA